MILYLLWGCSSEVKSVDEVLSNDFTDFWGSSDVSHTPRLNRLGHEQWKNAASQLLSFDAEPYATAFVQQPSDLQDRDEANPIHFIIINAAEQIAREIRFDIDWYQLVVPEDEREAGVSFSPIWGRMVVFWHKSIRIIRRAVFLLLFLGAPYLLM